ncbi:MAG TPA: glycerol-3-phosphate dehydrogenase/oxidase [Gammaproteobacteria bacterium]
MSAARGAPALAPGNDARFDLIVIGAGINGAAVAREAALRGARVLLVERRDVGGGTSATSSRLIHGGLRYLEHAELGLVRESLAERERLLALAPHLVAPLPLCIPVYERSRRPLWQIRVGLWLYERLAGPKSLPPYAVLSRAALLEELPGLAPEGLRGGARYFDGQVAFPERLVLENALDAVRHGATLATYTEVVGIRVRDGRVEGVDWRRGDGASGAAFAPVVVNAAGPWVDRVLGPLAERPLIGGTKGSHLIVAPFPGAPRTGVYVEAASDGRPFFILPWNGLYLIGTTDRRFTGDPGAVRIDADEVAYLCAETERVFPGAAPLRERVLYTHSGVRPLPYRPRGEEGAITRRHHVRPHPGVRGLYSIVGGKLTTHRALAEDVLRRVAAEARWARGESPTRDRPLPGALDAAAREELIAELAARFGPARARRLWHTYGGAARDVAERARDPELAAAIGEPPSLLVAELLHALESEWATTLADVLQRRTMLGLNARFGLDVAPAAAAALRRLGIWDDARAEAELADYRALAASARLEADAPG